MRKFVYLERNNGHLCDGDLQTLQPFLEIAKTTCKVFLCLASVERTSLVTNDMKTSRTFHAWT